MVKTSLKQKIWDKLDKDDYINDSELAKIYGKEPNWATAEEYKRQYFRLKADRDRFADKVILRAERFRGCKVSLDGIHWYKVGKDYFDEIKLNMVKDNSRPDLKIEIYKYDSMGINN